MELRKLQATDLFSMVRILNGVGFDKVKEAVNSTDIKESRAKFANKDLTEDERNRIANEIGTNIIMSVLAVVLERLPAIETDLYKFVGSVANMKDKDVARLDIGEFMDLLIAIAQKDEFKDFFKRASKLIR